MDKTILIKYLNGACDAQESLEIAILFELSPEVRHDFETLKADWQAGNLQSDTPQSDEIEAELEKYLVKIDALRKQEQGTTHYLKNERPGLKLIFRIAALIIVSLGVGSIITYFSLSGKSENSGYGNLTHMVIAPKGSNSVSILPDGTKVWLNAGTTLKYTNKFGTISREVELVGEAYFKVATNPEKPFTVITSELKIMALGTAFNVKAYPDEKEITTTLEEGKVSIQGQGIHVTLKPRQNLTYERQKFLPGELKEKAKKDVGVENPELIAKNPAVNMLSDVNTQLYTSWKDGKWIIESATLSEAAVLLERKFNITVQIESESILTYKFSGTFTNETLEQILNVFRYTAPIEYKIDKGIVTIKPDIKRKANYQDIIKD